MGRIRAKQDRIGDSARRRGMAVLIHGDAAFAGEGVVQESLNLSGLAGYRTGGTLHVIVNNQMGFTTSPGEGRSSTYATDVAKMLPVPIFHVNGEDPQAVAQVVELAMDFRAEFQRDVVIDMYAYRRWGHNEADEPSFTQPLVYKAIEQRPSVRDSYLKHLLELGKVTEDGSRSRSPTRSVTTWNGSSTKPRRFSRNRSRSRRRLRGNRTTAAASRTMGRKPACRCDQPEVAHGAYRPHARRFPSSQEAAAQHRAPPKNGQGRGAARLVGRRSAGRSRRSPWKAIPCG